MSQLREAEPDFALLSPECRFHFGTSSLARARRAKAPADLSFGAARERENDERDALAALRERQRLALTPQRAARLVVKLTGAEGGRSSTANYTASAKAHPSGVPVACHRSGTHQQR